MTSLLRPILIGASAYTVATFPLAVLWHIGLFEPTYRSFGYFGESPSFSLGFLSILIQGVVLSYGYSRIRFSGGSTSSGLRYALFMGIFFWTCHVIAFAAKNPSSNAWTFFLMETIYLFFQFGIFGTVIGHIFAKHQNPETM